MVEKIHASEAMPIHEFHEKLAELYDEKLICAAFSALAKNETWLNKVDDWAEDRKPISAKDQKTWIHKIEELRTFEPSKAPIPFPELLAKFTTAYTARAVNSAITRLKQDKAWEPLIQSWENGTHVPYDYQVTMDAYIKTVAFGKPFSG